MNEDVSDSEEDQSFELESGSWRKSTGKYKFKKSDMKSLLIDLYGSKEGFLIEYEHFLAEKLLFSKDLNLKEEEKHLELLKSHFSGNLNLSRCKVLLKDYKNSLDRMADLPNKSHFFNFLLVSKSFWPIDYEENSFNTSNIFINKDIENFKKQFEIQNPLKTTVIHDNLGKVEMDLKIKDKKIMVICQPIHAAIISLFSKNEGYKEDEGVCLELIIEKLNASEEYIKSKINFWTSKGILKEKENQITFSSVYFLCKDFNDQKEIISANLEEDNEQFIQSGQVKGETSESKKTAIQGMLQDIMKFLHLVSLEEIENLLKTIYKVMFTRKNLRLEC